MMTRAQHTASILRCIRPSCIADGAPARRLCPPSTAVPGFVPDAVGSWSQQGLRVLADAAFLQHDVVGYTLSILWTERRVRRAHVCSFDEKRGLHTLEFDDGERQAHRLRDLSFCVMELPLGELLPLAEAVGDSYADDDMPVDCVVLV